VREPPVNIGDVLAGKYAVEKILGCGAMGVVVAACQLELDRRVALKFMVGARLGPEHRARFLREARAAGQLQGQHVARVLDVGQLTGGEPYIVMEYLDGKDLAAVLAERGPLPVEEAVLYVLQAAEALAEAHAAGIVHRDVKPANLFLIRGVDGAPCIKLVDFGVAKVSDGQLHLTGPVQVLGSPSYMSPESLEGGQNADARTDIWALAVTLYELLAGAGVVPFQAPELHALMKRVWFDPPVPLAKHRPDLPRGLSEVIAQALEKEPDRRFQSVAAFVAALAPYGPARQATPQGTPRPMVLAMSVLVVGVLLALALFLGLRARASAPEPVTTISATPSAIAATAKPTGPFTIEPAGTATATPSAEPAAPVAPTTPSTVAAPSATPHAKPPATKPQARPGDGADNRWAAPRH
jgi:eukaryotic-like serine/threonine-protein kinase